MQEHINLGPSDELVFVLWTIFLPSLNSTINQFKRASIQKYVGTYNDRLSECKIIFS